MSVPKATMPVTSTPVSCATLLGIGNPPRITGVLGMGCAKVKQSLRTRLTPARLTLPGSRGKTFCASKLLETAGGQLITDRLGMFGIARFHRQFQGGGLGGNAGHHAIVGNLQHIAAGIGDDAGN